MESWGSQYAGDLGVLNINSGHQDYERAKSAGAKAQMRYVATLYAKELVLLNFGNVPVSQLLESMVELTTVLESKLYPDISRPGPITPAYCGGRWG